MSENTTSHTQQTEQTVGAWKKIVDKQVDLVGSISEKAAKARKASFDKAVENIDEINRFSKESLEQAQELVDPREPTAAFTDLMNRQLEVAHGLTSSWTDMQGDGIEKVRSTFKTLSDLSDTTLEHTVKMNKAWHDAAMETAKRAVGWMPSSH